jgi:hypothetical protein
MSGAFSAPAMPQITAERLVEHLERSGYVVMCRTPTPPYATSEHLPAMRQSSANHR